jgi:hypothetical protein
VIEIDGRVVGHIASFDLEGRREVTYWIGRENWGRGIATRALQEFLKLEANPSALRWRRERQRRVDSGVDEVRFRDRGRGPRVRLWAQRGNGRGRPPTGCLTRLPSAGPACGNVTRKREQGWVSHFPQKATRGTATRQVWPNPSTP